MRILFIRHGNPDYKNDCLTELGQRQAASAAKRLMGEGISRIFSSTCGRALETAEHTARALGLAVERCDFMREVDWTPKVETPIYADGHMWYCADEYVRRGKDLTATDWREDELFVGSHAADSLDRLGASLDGWLSSLGYEREGTLYRVRQANDETVAMFCHGGAFACALAHMMHLPLPFTVYTFSFKQTGIFAVNLDGDQGRLIAPWLRSVEQCEHLRRDGIEVT